MLIWHSSRTTSVMTWCWTVIRTHYLHGDEQMRYVLNNGRFYWTRPSLFKKDISHNNFLGVWQLWSFSENYSHFLDIKGRADIFLFQWLAATTLAACRFTAGASNFHFRLKRKGKNIFFQGRFLLGGWRFPPTYNIYKPFLNLLEGSL